MTAFEQTTSISKLIVFVTATSFFKCKSYLYENEAGDDALVLIVFVGKVTVLQPALSFGVGHVCTKGGEAE